MDSETAKANREAAESLALEMGIYNGGHFLRAELGISLREACFLMERLAGEHPASPLAEALRRNGGSLTLRRP